MATVSWTDLEPSRAVGRAVTTAVRCASMVDPAAYALATATLSELPSAPTGSVSAAVVRMLLEDEHPGGLDGDDIREVIGRCIADALNWLPGAAVSTSVLVAVLSSALGIQEAGVTYVELLTPDPSRGTTEWVDPETAGGERSSPAAGNTLQPPTTAEYSWHAPLLIASLLGVAGRPLSRYLDTAFAEIARSETMEMP